MAIIYYVADPMCSWCYAFQATITAIDEEFGEKIKWRYVMGGLAKDSDEAMPMETQQFVQQNWREIENRSGVKFNWDFWTTCKPRRSTYPACRAVIAMRQRSAHFEASMFRAIQRAYYQEAQNPSDIETLEQVAESLDARLKDGEFREDLLAATVESTLQADFAKRRELNVRSFPSLVLEDSEGQTQLIQSGWNESDAVLATLRKALER